MHAKKLIVSNAKCPLYNTTEWIHIYVGGAKRKASRTCRMLYMYIYCKHFYWEVSHTVRVI